MRRTVLRIGGFLILTGAAATDLASQPRIHTLVGDSATIFVAEIREAHSQGDCTRFKRHVPGSGCNTVVRATITRVLKGGDGEPAPRDFEILVQQTIGRSAATTRWEREIEPGQRYLIFSPGTQGLPGMFASTLSPVPVAPDEDVASDVELIVNLGHLTLQQQATAVATSIRTTTVPHSWLLGQYTAGLLAAGSDRETSDLAQTIESSPDGTFSFLGKFLFLASLWGASQSATSPPRNLIHVYAVMAIKYLPAKADPRSLDLPDLRTDILSRHIPWIVKSERATSLLRAVTPSESAARAARKAQEMSADGHLQDNERSELRLIAALLRGQ